jgi:type IV secretory pathway VirJ component
MKELNALYEDQYWRLLEDLRKRHYRFSLRHGHGGRKNDAAAETAAREKTGAAQLSECETAGCGERPMPLTTYCFAHILSDPKQVLYAAAAKTSPSDPEPVLRTEEAAAAADVPKVAKVAKVAATEQDTEKKDAEDAGESVKANPESANPENAEAKKA